MTGLFSSLRFRAGGALDPHASAVAHSGRRAPKAQLEAVREANEATVAALAAALELRDDETGSHAYRVTQLALSIARVVDAELAARSEARFGYLLHDIGKIGIPDRILLKPSALTSDEKRIMETHTELGEYLISSLRHLQGVARDVIVHHHERWDGNGYPVGLAGEEIPLAARIFAVADAFDALTSDRPYRLAVTEDEALIEIRRHAGTQFDPAVVRALLDVRREAARLESDLGFEPKAGSAVD